MVNRKITTKVDFVMYQHKTLSQLLLIQDAISIRIVIIINVITTKRLIVIMEDVIVKVCFNTQTCNKDYS